MSRYTTRFPVPFLDGNSVEKTRYRAQLTEFNLIFGALPS